MLRERDMGCSLAPYVDTVISYVQTTCFPACCCLDSASLVHHYCSFAACLSHLLQDLPSSGRNAKSRTDLAAFLDRLFASDPALCTNTLFTSCWVYKRLDILGIPNFLSSFEPLHRLPVEDCRLGACPSLTFIMRHARYRCKLIFECSGFSSNILRTSKESKCDRMPDVEEAKLS